MESFRLIILSASRSCAALAPGRGRATGPPRVALGRSVAPGRPGPRARKGGVRNANVESFRLMILDMSAPIARRWPRDGAALLGRYSSPGKASETALHRAAKPLWCMGPACHRRD